MTKDWSGNGKSTFITIGASNHTDKEREEILKELNRTANGNCEWRPIPNYEHRFLISSDGQVFSLFSKRIMKLETLSNGYIYLPIMEQKPKRHVVTAYIHRLVAITFIPNEQNKKTVNHIDGDKKNNNIRNLEWATQSEQNFHACRVLGRKRNTAKIQQINKGRRILTWEEVEYVRRYGLSRKEIIKIFGKDVKSLKLKEVMSHKVYKVE